MNTLKSTRNTRTTKSPRELRLNYETLWDAAEESDRALAEVVTSHALAAVAWYLRDKRWKRTISKFLRAFTIVGVSLGALTPAIHSLSPRIPLEIGYILVGLAALTYSADRYYGFSSGWMRDQQIINDIDELLLEFSATQPFNSPSDPPVKSQARLNSFSFLRSLQRLCAQETSEWIVEFSDNQKRLSSEIAKSQHNPGLETSSDAPEIRSAANVVAPGSKSTQSSK